MKDILLHTCCGPCAAGCIPRITQDLKCVLYFSNSNLCSRDEYDLRFENAQKVASAYNLELIADEYDHEAWLNAVEGFEDAPERGERCRRCFKFSLSRTALKAVELGDFVFATSLTVSPYKDSKTIFETGGLFDNFEEIDFKKNDGYRLSVENSRLLNLYRQKFCGCEFSKRDAENREKRK